MVKFILISHHPKFNISEKSLLISAEAVRTVVLDYLKGDEYERRIAGNKLILGIVLGVITFWLFAQSLVNVVPNLQQSFGETLQNYSGQSNCTIFRYVCRWSRWSSR